MHLRNDKLFVNYKLSDASILNGNELYIVIPSKELQLNTAAITAVL